MPRSWWPRRPPTRPPARCATRSSRIDTQRGYPLGFVGLPSLPFEGRKTHAPASRPRSRVWYWSRRRNQPPPRAAQHRPRRPAAAFLLPDNPVLLAPNLANPVQSHDAHFRSQANAQATLRQLNAGIAAQLATFPIGSSSGGFTYTFDETLGVYNRTTQSFGPIFAERPLTLGKNKFALAVNYQHASWDRFEGRDLRRRRAAALPDARGHEPRRRQPEPVLRGRHHQGRPRDRPQDRHHRAARELRGERAAGRRRGRAVPEHRHGRQRHGDDRSTSRRSRRPPSSTSSTRTAPSRTCIRRAGTRTGSGTCCCGPSGTSTAAPPRARALGGDLRMPTGDEADLLGSGATQFKLWRRDRRLAGPLLAARELRLHLLERRQRVHRRPARRAQLHGRLRRRRPPAADDRGRLRGPHAARRRAARARGPHLPVHPAQRSDGEIGDAPAARQQDRQHGPLPRLGGLQVQPGGPPADRRQRADLDGRRRPAVAGHAVYSDWTTRSSGATESVGFVPVVRGEPTTYFSNE